MLVQTPITNVSPGNLKFMKTVYDIKLLFVVILESIYYSIIFDTYFSNQMIRNWLPLFMYILGILLWWERKRLRMFSFIGRSRMLRLMRRGIESENIGMVMMTNMNKRRKNGEGELL